MLPQSQALKETAADTPRDRSETGCFELSNQLPVSQLVEGRESSDSVCKGRKAKPDVFVLDKRKKPLMPCSFERSQKLLKAKRAVVHKVFPFTIRLKDRIGGDVQPILVKLDTGSKKTGVALVRVESNQNQAVLGLIELEHRGKQISESLTQRSAFRRRRRSKNLRYRAPRFLNRTKPKGWLAPSLQHRVDTTFSLVTKLRRLIPVSGIIQELVKFDTQLLENAEISGEGYQQGTLAGTELREYVLERDGRKCLYCGAKDCPLNLDHVEPKSKGGSLRPGNLVLACVSCNLRKSNRSVKEFLKDKPEVLKRVLAQLKKPLRDAAAVNATRWALWRKLSNLGLPLETGTGGRTKWNRTRFNIPKSHGLDAACAGKTESVSGWQVPALAMKCMGRGAYQRTRLDSFGFPRGYLMRSKAVFGFQTGDIVKAIVTKGKHTGTHVWRVAVRATGSFDLRIKALVRQGISHKYMRLIQRNDGYGYSIESKKEALPHAA